MAEFERKVLGPATAYAIAVKNGFEGTEEKWLASLKGAQGEIGPQGPAGVDGAQGEQGPQGPSGNDYVLTEADKNEIAELALTKLPTWTGGSY